MKLLMSEFYPISGTAITWLTHKGKIYKGKAQYKESNINPPNRFFGQRIAEKRALIEYWKERRTINKIKQQALESFKKDLDTYVYDGVLEEGLYETILDKLDEHIKYYGKEAKDCKEIIQTQKKNIEKDIKLRQQLLERKGQ